MVRDEEGRVFSFAINAPEVFNNEWHHFAYNFISMSENKAEIYIDGIKHEFTFINEGSPQSFNYFHNPFPIGAGNYRGIIDEYFEGILDDFRIYKEAFSEQQILLLFYSQPD